MPCSDSGREWADRNEKKRLDELAKQACDAGKVIHALVGELSRSSFGNFDMARLGPDNARLMREVLIRHDAHREHDKETALNLAKANLGKATSNITRIRELGGEPRDDLLDAHKILQDRVIAIHGSNPHKTDLY